MPSREPIPQRPRTTAAAFVLLGASIFGLAGWRVADPQPLPTGSLRVETAYRIDLNHADAATLRLLPGVGPALADNIIEHRQAHGPFTEASQLEAVHRIGPVLRQRMTPWVHFGPAAPGRDGERK